MGAQPRVPPGEPAETSWEVTDSEAAEGAAEAAVNIAKAGIRCHSGLGPLMQIRLRVKPRPRKPETVTKDQPCPTPKSAMSPAPGRASLRL